MPRCRPALTRLITAGALAAGLSGLAGPDTAHAQTPAHDQAWRMCAAATDAAEAMRPDLPAHLLGALAKVESGRWHDASKARLAWPWTVMGDICRARPPRSPRCAGSRHAA